MKKLLMITTVAAMTAGAGFAQTVRIGSEGAYPPYNFVDDSGQLVGFEIDLGNQLCERAELECTWVKNDWDSIIPNLVSSNYDAIMAGMDITEERKKAVQFTKSYVPSTSAYAALSPDVDVENGVIAVQTSTIQAAHVAETGVDMLEFPTPDEAVGAVRNGEADAIFLDKDYLAPIVKESAAGLVWVDGHDSIALGEGMGMALRQSDSELKEKFDTAITGMISDGSLNDLLTKWFGDDAILFDTTAQ